MRNYKIETEKRVEYIKNILSASGFDGIVFANSGGKDCVLAGILCKMACANTLGLILPCESKRNFHEDSNDAMKVAVQFGIEMRVIDLTETKRTLMNVLDIQVEMNYLATININPRLRMITLYAISAAEKRLVLGTGNRSERYMGYFTLWGDGAFDFNPIADLTVTEVYEFLTYLGVPKNIIKKAPSAGLFEGQTDEAEMGVTYKAIDDYLLYGTVNEKDKAVIDRYHNRSEYKRNLPSMFEDILS
ncbi:MAG: NAD(+) synthase [Oscillospiraceae bacterium]|nr:NAD(+) synthase [Oscillospiraceae bacterium]